jgi:hypothetical protein
MATAEAKKQLMDDPNTNIHDRWNFFVELFNRKYKDQAETDMRKKLFVDCVTKIDEHNKKYEAKEVTFSMGINQFADSTDEERKKMCGVRPH